MALLKVMPSYLLLDFVFRLANLWPRHCVMFKFVSQINNIRGSYSKTKQLLFNLVEKVTS